MLSERNKKTTEIIMALISLTLNTMFVVPYDSLSMLWGKLRFYYWGWVPAIILPTATIALIIIWKAGSKILRGFTLLISILALIIGVILYSLLYIISQPGIWANAL